MFLEDEFDYWKSEAYKNMSWIQERQKKKNIYDEAIQELLLTKQHEKLPCWDKEKWEIENFIETGI